MSKMEQGVKLAVGAVAAAAALAASPAMAWEPTKPVEFVVPAGTGGGADQMARLIQGIIVKHKLMSQPLIIVNKSGGAGAEGFLAVKGSQGNPHQLIITLSNLFTTPMATGVPFNWRDMTPIGMMALDQFVLWVNADSPYKTAKDYAAAIKANSGKLKMGGTGSKQEDQLITVALEKAVGGKMIYVPFKGGGEVAVQLVGGHIDSSVNNPAEAVAQWRAGKLRALCVFDDHKMPYKEKVTDTQSWGDIPTCKEAGIPVSYTMLRGIFAAPGIKPDEVAYYEGLLKKVMATPDWKEYMEKGAFNTTTKFGNDFKTWLGQAEAEHRNLMKEAGFLAK